MTLYDPPNEPSFEIPRLKRVSWTQFRHPQAWVLKVASGDARMSQQRAHLFQVMVLL